MDLGGIWVSGEGVPEALGEEIERLALRAFRLCTDADEWIWAWNAPDDYSDELYRFWPHRAQEPVDWHASFFPDADNQVFVSVSQAFDWGVHAYWSYPGLAGSALHVFGQPLLDALAGTWPRGWSEIVETNHRGRPSRLHRLTALPLGGQSSSRWPPRQTLTT